MPAKKRSSGAASSPTRCVEMVQRVLPGDTNPHGTVFGGKVMEWIDIAGGVAAIRHTQATVVTASFDRVDFHAPARTGDVMVLRAELNYTGKTSVEVGVQVQAEDPMSGKRVLTTEALITYVAINKAGKPIRVKPYRPKSRAEKRRYKEAEKRYQERRAARK